MAKFRTASPPPPTLPRSPIRSADAPDTTTHEGGAGFSRDARSELFLLAVANMVSEQTFYEKAEDRDARFEQLIAQVTAADPEWIARFVPYLRDKLNMRSASVVMAAEYVRARLADHGVPSVGRAAFNAAVIASALRRPDEPGELIGYWRSHYGVSDITGRTRAQLPMPVKRGIAAALAGLYNERAYIKYGAAEGVRMADVLELVHPEPLAPWQSALFAYMLADRHGRAGEVPAELPTLAANRAAIALTPEAFREAFTADFVETAGLTWEQASSRYGKLDTHFWQAMIPSMGYMALLRNLRNFDETGVPDDVAVTISAKLADPEQVARSRQLPLRFLSAYRQSSLRWHYPLEKALNACLANVPALPGRTLIMCDDSGSMDDPLSGRSTLQRRDAASVFTAALALRAEDPTVVAYANEGHSVSVPKGGSVLPLAGKISHATNGGTNTLQVLSAIYGGHDRVVILTDEQAFPVMGALAAWDQIAGIKAPIYTFNLAGYRAGHLPSGKGNRHTFGGLTDAAFPAIPLLERGVDQDWPF